MRRLIAAEGAGKIAFDLALRVATVLFAELHTDSSGTPALRAFRRHPNHPSRHRQFLVLAHQIEEHENFIAKPIVAVRWNEKTAVLHKGHVSKVERALVLDREREQSWFVAGLSHRYRHVLLPHRLTRWRRESVHYSEQHCFQGQLALQSRSRQGRFQFTNPVQTGKQAVYVQRWRAAWQ